MGASSRGGSYFRVWRERNSEWPEVRGMDTFKPVSLAGDVGEDACEEGHGVGEDLEESLNK